MGNPVIPLWVITAALAALLAVLVVFTVRRLVLSRTRGSFDCSFRRGAPAGDSGWTSGVASYGPGELRWYRLFSLSPRPSCVWQRTDLRIKEFQGPEGGESFALLPGAVVVTCEIGPAVLQLAMSTEAYTGFASWIEAAPPGQHARVT